MLIHQMAEELYYFMDFNPDLLAFSERDGDKEPGRIYVAKDIGAAVQNFLASHELVHILMHEHGKIFRFVP